MAQEASPASIEASSPETALSRFPMEAIPDNGLLYMRAHRAHFDENGDLEPGVFRDHQGGMSTEWDKYTTPQETHVRRGNPKDNAVISLPVQGIRAKTRQKVIHEPLDDCRAHTEVIGDKKSVSVDGTSDRYKLWQMHIVVIPLSEDESSVA